MNFRNPILLMVISGISLFTFHSSAGKNSNHKKQLYEQAQVLNPPATSVVTVTPGAQNDADLVRAVNDRRNVKFVEASGVIISRILPDDTQGMAHQKWFIKLSNGREVLAVYNSELGRRVPVQIGAVISLGGEFKMTNIGPLIHWLHHDPRRQRPDGYVEINGIRYGGK